MSVSDLGSEGRERGGLGLQLGVIIAESVKTVVKLTLVALICQVWVETRLDRKSSHPLLMALPVPAGCARVAVETWPNFLAWRFLLVWFPLTPQPWVEQKAPRCQWLLREASTWLMQR